MSRSELITFLIKISNDTQVRCSDDLKLKSLQNVARIPKSCILLNIFGIFKYLPTNWILSENKLTKRAILIQ